MERIKKSNDIDVGKLILAEPFMRDAYFKRAVILLCSHSDELGSVGLILNKKMKLKVDEVIDDFPEFDASVYYGGPVSGDSIHYIHDKGDILDGSEEIANGIYWGGDFGKLKFLIDKKLIHPWNIRFYIGYAGWSTMQLNDELKYGSWIVSDMFPNYILNSNPSNLWQTILKGHGDTYSVISQIPDFPILN